MDITGTDIILILIILILIIVCSSENKEKYCGGEQYYSDPEFPTYDHMGANKWTRYDLKSDNFPLSPYAPTGPYNF